MTDDAAESGAADAMPEQESVPEAGVLLGIDYGTKRIGVAMSNEEQTMALPLENYTRRSVKLDGEWMRQLASGYGARGLVIGLPVHMSGDEGGKAAEARAFGQWAREVTSLPVVWWDERFSSSAADVLLNQSESSSKKRRTSRRDQLAAQVILQSFLDADDRSADPVAFDARS